MTNYVLVRREVPKGPHIGRIYIRLADEAKEAYQVLRKYRIETGPIVTATTDNTRYGPFIDVAEVPESLQRELDDLGFYLEGPFEDSWKALDFWHSGSKD
jgi:hypothetical protein